MCQLTDSNQVIADQCEAIQELMSVMDIHNNNVNVCRNGCGALLSIISNSQYS